MKYLLFIFAVLFAVSACSGPNIFAPIADKPPAKETEQGDYQSKIPSVVEGEMKKKVGGKDRKTINIPKTVSEKNLGNKKSIVTNVSVTNVIVEGKQKGKAKKAGKVREKVIKRVIERVIERVVERVVEKPKKASAAPPEKKLDILFYMHDRDTSCIRNVIAYSEKKGFLKSLNHLDWQVSFSYYTQGDVGAMLPLEWNNGKAANMSNDFWKVKEDYVLSKGEYSQKQADHLFNTTLQAFHPEEDSSVGQNTNPELYWAVLNPLSGLDRILSQKTNGAVRSDSHVVALLFGYDFAYYSSVEWKNFFNKHKNVSLIAVSYRSSNVSNFMHVLKGYNFDFLPACDNSSSPAQLVQAIKNKVQ